VYKNSGRLFPSKTITISERQMKELLESVKELQIKYKDLEKLIEEDPGLKKNIEKKLIENNRTKINL
jgi:signal recognition particle subunit SEC65